MKKIPGFLEDRDKTVRDEGKAMVVEIYRYFCDSRHWNMDFFTIFLLFQVGRRTPEAAIEHLEANSSD